MLSVNVRYEEKNTHSTDVLVIKNMYIKLLWLRCLTAWIGSLIMAASASYGQHQSENANIDIVMLGDSITQAGPWNSLFPNAQILNRGVSGYSTYDILREINTTVEIRPRKVFLMIGINDLLRGASVEETFDRYRIIVDTLQKAGIKVYMQATIECARAQCGAIVDQVRSLNEKLKRVAQMRGLTWIDLNSGLTSQTQGLLERYTTDGLHLTVPAYKYWAEQIGKHIIGI